MFDYIFKDGTLKQYIQENSFDYWTGTEFEGYTALSSPNKGVFGEMFVQKFMEQRGSSVMERENKGHDRIIDGYKTEIKFSLGANSKLKKSQRENVYRINHLSTRKDYERVIFFGINRDFKKSIFIWWDSFDFNSYVENSTGIFSHQQGGKKQKIDDYMFAGDNIDTLLNLDFVKNIDDWTKKKQGLEIFYA